MMRLSEKVVISWLILLWVTFFVGCFGDQLRHRQGRSQKSKLGSTAVFRVGGNVYPDGYFYATLNIGQPPKPYDLDIDTGSDLTWVQCDAPCVHCPKGPHDPYKPRNNVVQCEDPICAFIQHPRNFPCHRPVDQCDYEIEYADHGLSTGVLVKDVFSLQFLNSSIARPSLTFGCGYDQEIPSSSHPPFVDGVLGLANGKSSILSQLRDMGITQNVFGHCFNSRGGGYLFFGDGFIPSNGVVSVAMSKTSVGKYYSLGPAELLLAGQNVVKGGLPLVFDSGSTYSYFNAPAYRATISIIKKNIDSKQLKDAPEDKTLPVCWKGARPLKSINDVRKLFKPLTLRFSNAKTALEMPPEAYLILSKNGNACLGILDGSEAELGNLNVLGDISLQDKMVIYDNEKQTIGWIPANCDKLPNVDRSFDEGFPDMCPAHFSFSGIFDELYRNIGKYWET